MRVRELEVLKIFFGAGFFMALVVLSLLTYYATIVAVAVLIVLAMRAWQRHQLRRRARRKLGPLGYVPRPDDTREIR